MFRLIRSTAKEASQQLALLREIFWLGRVWTRYGYMAERPPRMVRIAHAISLSVVRSLLTSIHPARQPA
jgi:hypothetical protein